MEIERKMIAYIEENNISKNVMAEVLDIDIEKFAMEKEQTWSAQELLQICAYLKVAPDRV